MNTIEPLDFCRVKKIDEKGFGFLKSLYYDGDIFFHFTQIKKQVFLDKLNSLKRGDFFVYFTSTLQPTGKRKLNKIWYEIEEIPAEMLTDFTGKIINEFNSGKTNIYDLLYIFEKLREINFLTIAHVRLIMASDRVMKLPTTLLPFLKPEEIPVFKEVINIDQYKDADPKPFWYQEFPV